MATDRGMVQRAQPSTSSANVWGKFSPSKLTCGQHSSAARERWGTLRSSAHQRRFHCCSFMSKPHGNPRKGKRFLSRAAIQTPGEAMRRRQTSAPSGGFHPQKAAVVFGEANHSTHTECHDTVPRYQCFRLTTH